MAVNSGTLSLVSSSTPTNATEVLIPTPAPTATPTATPNGTTSDEPVSSPVTPPEPSEPAHAAAKPGPITQTPPAEQHESEEHSTSSSPSSSPYSTPSPAPTHESDDSHDGGSSHLDD
jgi:hypothetical protein